MKVIRASDTGWLGDFSRLTSAKLAKRFKTMKAAKRAIPSWVGKGGYVEIYKREWGKKEKKLAFSNNPCILFKLAKQAEG